MENITESTENTDLLIVKDKYFLIIDNKGNRKLSTVNSKVLKMGKREFIVEFFEGKQLNTFWAIEPATEEDKEIKDKSVFIYKKEKYTQISHNEFFGESLSNN
jgi:hypothetical protein